MVIKKHYLRCNTPERVFSFKFIKKLHKTTYDASSAISSHIHYYIRILLLSHVDKLGMLFTPYSATYMVFIILKCIHEVNYNYCS